MFMTQPITEPAHATPRSVLRQAGNLPMGQRTGKKRGAAAIKLSTACQWSRPLDIRKRRC